MFYLKVTFKKVLEVIGNGVMVAITALDAYVEYEKFRKKRQKRLKKQRKEGRVDAK